MKNKTPEIWQIPVIWPNGTVVCIGSGNSLTSDDCFYAAASTDVDGIIGINDVYRLYPAIHILYACDHKWWSWHYDKVKLTASLAKLVTGQKQAKIQYPDLHLLKIAHHPGWSNIPDTLHGGGHSGYQAINLAMLAGATRIILLGYDMKGPHFFGDHPDKSRQNFSEWLEAFKGTDAQAKSRGVKIINCTRETALNEFEKMPLEVALP